MATDGDPADDDDAALEGERYQGVRDLFRQARDEGFDEEPPARLDALLMAAAREHAPKKAPFLERVRRWLVSTTMQPAVAGAVAIAVIGGTAGVLYMKGKGGVAEPTVGAPSSDPAPRAAGEEAQPYRDLPASGAAVTTSNGTADLQAALRQQEQDQREREAQPDPRERPKLESGPGGGRGGGGTRGAGTSGGDGVADPFAGTEKPLEFKPDDRAATTVVTTSDDRGGGGGGAVAVGGVKTTITGTSPPPPPPPDVTIATDDEVIEEKEKVEVTAQSEGRSTTSGPSKRAQAENLFRQARTAARNKNCAAVRTMAKRVKDLDAVYYNETFVRDAAVKACL